MQPCSSGPPPPPLPAAGGAPRDGNQVRYVAVDDIPPQVSDYELMEKHFRPRLHAFTYAGLLALVFNDGGRMALLRGRDDRYAGLPFVPTPYSRVLSLLMAERCFSNIESSRTRERGHRKRRQGWGIRDPNQQEPRFVGIKRHYTSEETATDYGINVYQLLDDDNRVQEGVVMRRVLSEDNLPDPPHAAENTWPLQPNHAAPETNSVLPENDDGICFHVEQILPDSPLLEDTEGATVDVPTFAPNVCLPTYTPHGEGPSTATAIDNERPRKKKKQHARQTSTSSNVLEYFTKLFDGEEVLAACHRCNALLTGSPKKDGTSHLRRHANVTCPAQ